MLPVSPASVETSRIDNRVVQPTSPDSRREQTAVAATPLGTDSLVSDVSARSAALHNLAESLRMTQLAESALSTVSSELNSLEAAVRVGNPATEDSSQARAAIDRALGALPETAKPMVPAGPDSGVYSVPMSSGTLVPDWSSNSGVPGHEQLAAAQEVVQHVLANLASSREELLSAAGALGLSSAVPADQARPGDSVLARAAGDLMAGADLSAVHGQLSVGGALKSLTP